MSDYLDNYLQPYIILCVFQVNLSAGFLNHQRWAGSILLIVRTITITCIALICTYSITLEQFFSNFAPDFFNVNEQYFFLPVL